MNQFAKITLASLTILGAVVAFGAPGSAMSNRSHCSTSSSYQGCYDPRFRGSFYGTQPTAAAPAPTTSTGIREESGLHGLHGPGW